MVLDNPEKQQVEKKVMTGGHALAKMLEISEVGPIFGMAGFQLLPFYEGIRQLGMEHYLINDERGGGFAADAYARVTGRPGVCDATLGPGATNLVTSLVESLNAGVPIIAITGNTDRNHSWKNMTQESQQIDILKPAVKEVIRVEVAERIPELVRKAFSIATSGRPGPVLLDIPEDVSHAHCEFEKSDFYIKKRVCSIPSLRTRPEEKYLKEAASLITKAKRPVILAGGGVHLSNAHEELLYLAEKNNIPVANTLSGKGAIACTHSLSLGLFGRYSRVANDLIDTSDCIIVIGCKLGEIATKRYELPKKGTPLIHIDISPEEIERWAPANVSLWGDAKLSLQDLATSIDELKGTENQNKSEYTEEIKSRIKKWQEGAQKRYKSNEKPINMGRVMNELNNVMPSDSILVVDGGFAAHWGGLLYDTKNAGRSFIADRGSASIGYGLPASIGAKLGLQYLGKSDPIVGITGDGGMNMTIGELETAIRAKLDFTLIVVNNAASGYIKALQHSFYGKGQYQSSTLVDSNYANLAKAYGAYGIRVEDPNEISAALKKAMDNKGVPTIIDVVVTRDPAEMLPGVDNRALKIKSGDRPI